MKIYHNPRCRKSRETLAIIEQSGQEPEIIRYLDTPPSKEELRNILGLLGMPASALVRRSEVLYREKYKGKNISEEEWLDILVKNPRLMERPIVVNNGRAVLGRPPENVKRLL